MTGASAVAAGMADANGSKGYGLNGGAGASLAVRSGQRGRALRLAPASRRSAFVNDTVKTFTPFADFWDAAGGSSPFVTGFSPNVHAPIPSSGSGFDWSQVFGVITQAAPAIISAARGQGVPPGYYPTAVQGQQVQYQQIPEGYEYQNGQLVRGGAGVGAQAGQGIENLANSVTTFVTNNPLIVLGGVVGLVLLFRQPPSRR